MFCTQISPSLNSIFPQTEVKLYFVVYWFIAFIVCYLLVTRMNFHEDKYLLLTQNINCLVSRLVNRPVLNKHLGNEGKSWLFSLQEVAFIACWKRLLCRLVRFQGIAVFHISMLFPSALCTRQHYKSACILISGFPLFEGKGLASSVSTHLSEASVPLLFSTLLGCPLSLLDQASWHCQLPCLSCCCKVSLPALPCTWQNPYGHSHPNCNSTNLGGTFSLHWTRPPCTCSLVPHYTYHLSVIILHWPVISMNADSESVFAHLYTLIAKPRSGAQQVLRYTCWVKWLLLKYQY